MHVSRVLLSAAIFSALYLADLAAPTRAADVANAPGGSSRAQQLVADALQAELTGNIARRRVLLSEAVDAAPDFAPARWHAGQILTKGEWLPVVKDQEVAAADPKRAEYERLRDAGGSMPDIQLKLARWCRKNAFHDEANFHWRSLLVQDPQNEEALRALGVRWFYGALMTPDEIQAAKDFLRESRAKAKAFEPTVARWERMLWAGDLTSRNAALGEIRQVRDPQVFPAIEEITLDRSLPTNEEFERSLEMGQALVAALDEIPAHAATNSLLRHAIFAPTKSVREASMIALKKRPLHDYIPALLSLLAMPVESSYRVVSDADGSVHYFHSLYREGPMADWSFEGRLSAMQHDLHGPTHVTFTDNKPDKDPRVRFDAANNPIVRAEMASVAGENQQRFGGQANAAEQRIAAANRATEAANAMVIPVLVETTGENFGDNPRAWWDWWLRYNEYSSDQERPVQEQRYADSTHRYYRAPSEKSVYVGPVSDLVEKKPTNRLPYRQQGRRQVEYPRTPPPPRGLECFAAGTPVWTRTGLRPIESLEMGDLVLAQNAETGELSYKPVLGRTVRQPKACRKLSIGEDSLVAVDGHPFWVVGTGWKMVKELEDGATLHTVNGPTTLAAIENVDAVETFNLIVADFNTYFVGKGGILVHDNTPRHATTQKLPGLLDP